MKKVMIVNSLRSDTGGWLVVQRAIDDFWWNLLVLTGEIHGWVECTEAQLRCRKEGCHEGLAVLCECVLWLWLWLLIKEPEPSTDGDYRF